MGRIYQLPPEVVTKIAAGEVIERPASVVKEMLENSLDARATSIEVELEQGGIDLIRIVDNGHGILPEDLPLVFASHATSKLKNADDLFQIMTLGFRGEAMASIGGIAQVTVQSRVADLPEGAEIRCHGGELFPVRPWNGSLGTRIEVKHLFYNTPVRKKFLKTTATELGHVSEIVTRLALSSPGVHFLLKHNNRLVYEVPAEASFKDRIALFFGDELAKRLIPIEFSRDGMTLTGCVGDPSDDKANAKLQYFFLNGRFIRDRSLGHALQESYRGLLMTGRYPAAFLFLTVPPDTVDVNVHPTKTEVRFRDSSTVYHLVRSAIKQALLKHDLVPQLQLPESSPRREKIEQTQAPWETPAPQPTLFQPTQEKIVEPPPPVSWEQIVGKPKPAAVPHSPFGKPRDEDSPIVEAPWNAPVEKSMPATRTVGPATSGQGITPVAGPASVSLTDAKQRTGENQASANRVPTNEITPNEFTPNEFTAGQAPTLPVPANEIPAGQAPTRPAPTNQAFPIAAERLPTKAIQIHNSFLVVETPDGMLVIDQHALHERILFEQIRRRISEGKLEVQRLLIPEPVELSLHQAALVMEQQQALQELGIEIEDFGGGTIAVSSYPALMKRASPLTIFNGVLEVILTKDRPPSRSQLFDHLMATIACKAAIKAGDPLTLEEIDYLMQLRQLAEDSHHCPHGRPTSLMFSRKELEKQFGRL